MWTVEASLLYPLHLNRKWTAYWTCWLLDCFSRWCQPWESCWVSTHFDKAWNRSSSLRWCPWRWSSDETRRRFEATCGSCSPGDWRSRTLRWMSGIADYPRKYKSWTWIWTIGWCSSVPYLHFYFSSFYNTSRSYTMI